MAISEDLALWRVVEAPGGWKVEDNGGVTLAIVPVKDAPNEEGQSGLSRHEAWLLANCIASLPDILLRTGRKSQMDMARNEPDQIDLRQLYGCLRLN